MPHIIISEFSRKLSYVALSKVVSIHPIMHGFWIIKAVTLTIHVCWVGILHGHLRVLDLINLVLHGTLQCCEFLLHVVEDTTSDHVSMAASPTC